MKLSMYKNCIWYDYMCSRYGVIILFYHFTMEHSSYSHTSWHKLTFLLSFSPFSCGSASPFAFLPCSEEGPLCHFAVECPRPLPTTPHRTTVNGNLLQTPAAAWPGIASRCLCTYACHVVSAARCTLMLWGLMVAIFPADSDDCYAQV